MKAEDKTRDVAIAAWVVDTCLLFGSSVSTAHTVAAMFVDGINAKPHQKDL